jgi:hypothetical protein
MSRTAQGHVEGAGLGAPPMQGNYQDAASLNAHSVNKLNLDAYYERLPAEPMTIIELRNKVARIGRHHGAGQKAEVGAVVEGLVSMGGVRWIEWNGPGSWSDSPQTVQKVPLENMRKPMSRRGGTVEMVQDEFDNWKAIPQGQAPQYRRRVMLARLDLEAAEDKRRAEKRERLRAEFTESETP